ncbi:hypothetical protein MRS44_018094 [Fusarium solani]|uniref:uncharacterized protein n=1 Tax=Fusarium solani TaxID=169388 RepID=UPI0032C3FBA0|nr:hypothetical protein MRS44_018094 [Fusarium solani]
MASKFQISIVGVGQVGGAAAYALILSSLAGELLLVDTDIERRNGQVQDLRDVAYSCNNGTHVRAASHREAAKADMVVVAAGSKHTIGQTSLDYTSRNISIVREVVESMKPFGPDTILLIVANPVDLLTSLTRELSGLPPSQVFGSGTYLDSVRLRGLVAERSGVAADTVDISVLGVHGDSQVTAWSTATIGGTPIDKSAAAKVLNRDELADECKSRSQSIIRAKGATPFGLGSIISSICSSVLLDKGDVRPVSHYQQELGCCLSLPAVIGRKGVVSTMQRPLDSEEESRIARSAKDLKGIIEWVHCSY